MAHIMIIDDDELIAAFASEVLIDAGHACGWKTSGREALELMYTHRPDLVLLDQDMPGMSGATVLRRMRCSSVLYDMPVIMFTAVTGQRDEEQAIFNGAQDYLRKPFEQKTLLYKVQTLLHQRALREQHVPLSQWLAENSAVPDKRAADLDENFDDYLPEHIVPNRRFC